MAIPFFFEFYFSYQQKKLLDDWQKKNSRIVSRPVKKPKAAKKLTIEDVASGPAIIEIPKIGIRVGVVDGTTPADLARGPGFIKDTARPGQRGNIAISGHRTLYGAPFKKLNEVDAGDPIYLEVPGAKIVYRATEVKRVKSNDTSVIDDFRDDRITLTTCDPPFSSRYRLVVAGKLEKIDSTAAAK